jgi:hypothetical protein
MNINIIGIPNIPEINPGDDLPSLILAGLSSGDITLQRPP